MLGTAEVLTALLICLAVIVVVYTLFAICYWRIFVKAGLPGWKGLVPFYNMWALAVQIEEYSLAKIYLIVCVCYILPVIGVLAYYAIDCIIHYRLLLWMRKPGWFVVFAVMFRPLYLFLMAFLDFDCEGPDNPANFMS